MVSENLVTCKCKRKAGRCNTLGPIIRDLGGDIVLGEYIRRTAYFARDLATGGQVNYHLRELDRLWQQESLMAEHGADRLNNLLSHAVATTPYYADCEPHDFTSFPVTQKTTIKSRRDDFISRENLSAHGMTEVSTSGSTGTSVIFLMNSAKIARRRAEIIFFNRLAGLDLGVPFALVNAQATTNKKKNDWDRLKNNETHIVLSSLREQDLLLAAQRIVESHCRALIAWPSVLGEIANFALTRGLDLAGRVSTTISMGEALLPETRDVIAEAFACNVVNRYSTNETGVLGLGFLDSENMVVNRASYIVEILKLDSDVPAAVGEHGRVIVTDLYSHAMPLIRYDIGDLAMARRTSSPGVSEIAPVDGRYTEMIFDTSGDRVLPMRLVGALHKGRSIRKVSQYQFAQTGPNEYCINAVSPEPVLDEQLIGGALREALGADAYIGFNYVASITRLASGKRPLMVNKWRN